MTPLSADTFAAIRPTKIRFYLRRMGQLGYDPTAILSGTDVSPASLADRYQLVAFPDYIRIVTNMMRLTRRPTLAFELARDLRLSDLGILGHALSACSNAVEGIRFWQTYNSLFFGNLLEVREFNEGSLHCFEFAPGVNLQPHFLQFFLEEKLNIDIQVMRRFNNILTEHRFFTFTYPEPPHVDLYRTLFNTRLTFDAPQNLYAINLEDRYYHAPFPGADEETLDVCKAYLDDMTGILFKRKSFSTRLNLAIRSRLPRVLTVPQMAEHFKYTERTFCRYLEQENTCYQRELARAREELTKNYLMTSSLSVAEIAYALGYSDPGSLRRSFRSWTGMSIGQFRKANDHTPG